MAITRAQQAKQMLQNGGMLVQPGFGGARQGYRGEAAAASDRAGNRNAGRDTSDAGTGNVGGNFDRGSFQDAVKRGELKAEVERQQKEKIEEDLEKFRQLNSRSRKFQNFASKFSPVAMFASKFGPLNTRDFFTDKVLGSKNFSNMTKEQFANLTNEEQEDMFGDYMAGRMSGATDAYGNPIGDRGGGGINQIIPVDTTFADAPVTSAPVTPSTGENLTRIAYRLMADGGAVIDDEPRQAYGLGSIVKKAARAVKKVAKSDIGKIALLYAGTAGLGALGAGSAGTGFGFKMFAPSAVASNLGAAATRFGFADKFLTGDPFTKTVADFGKDRLAFSAARTAAGVPKLNLATKAGLGIAALSALPLLGVGVEDEEEQEELSPYLGEGLDIAAIRANPRKFQGQAYRLMAEGGDTEDAKEPVAKKVMPLIDMDGKEKDYRETGGFVDMGRMEKADDVPARLSKNEFVFTADAVRNAGDGSVDKGAEVMYNMMKNLEAGGEVSEESQGLEGARKMFQTSQRLEEVL
jgi:hypothetical protein